MTASLNGALQQPEIRPVCAADAPAMQAFVQALSAASRRWRFHGAISGCSPSLLRQMTQVDGRRHVALVACLPCQDGAVIVGEARYAVLHDGSAAEFAIAVADAQQGSGLARRLMRALMSAAREAGVRELVGEVLGGNERMAAFLKREGFAPEAADLFAATEPDVQRWLRHIDSPTPTRAGRDRSTWQTLRTWLQGHGLARVPDVATH